MKRNFGDFSLATTSPATTEGSYDLDIPRTLGPPSIPFSFNVYDAAVDPAMPPSDSVDVQTLPRGPPGRLCVDV